MAELSPEECTTQQRILCEPERLRILELLLTGPQSVSAIAESIDASVALTSHHLSVLKREGYVQATKSGRQVIYEVVKEKVVQTGKHKPRMMLGCCELQFPA